MDPMKRLGHNGIDEVKNHPFFKKINWETLLEEPSPYFIPLGKDLDAVYFKNQKVADDDIRMIIEDQQKFSSLKEDRDFRDFDDICY